MLPLGRRRAQLETWFHTDLLFWFRNRILPVTHSVADRWGLLDGQCQLRGTPLNSADGMIAATAMEHDLIVVVGSVYLYFALLFSFAYYGIARLVDSVFSPLAYSNLPRVLWIRILCGIQAMLVLTVGIGTIVKFLTRRLDKVRKAATFRMNTYKKP